MRVGLANWSEHFWLGLWALVVLSQVDCGNKVRGLQEGF